MGRVRGEERQGAISISTWHCGMGSRPEQAFMSREVSSHQPRGEIYTCLPLGCPLDSEKALTRLSVLCALHTEAT